MIERALELLNQFQMLLALLVPAGAVVVGFYVLGRHALPVRLALAVFGAGTAFLAFLTYRRYQSLVDYCRDSFEVAYGGDKLSCLEAQHWFAIHFELLALLVVELGLVVLVVGGLVRWQKLRPLAKHATS